MKNLWLLRKHTERKKHEKKKGVKGCPEKKSSPKRKKQALQRGEKSNDRKRIHRGER